MRYDDGVATPDVSYSYADAVRDGICRPVTFVPYDGVLQWRSGDDLVESSFADAVTAREAGRRYRTAISLELADGLPRILAAAHERLEEVRAGGHRDAGGLVVAADGEHARAVARVAARDRRAHKPTVVLHTEARAAEKLQAFTRSTDRWLVAVNMVSEGVDIPRLRVGVYATAAKTPLVFRQIVGRFVRTLPGRAARAQLALPARRPDPARARRRGRARAAPRPAPAGRGGRRLRSTRSTSGARPSVARRRRSSRWRPTSRPSWRCSPAARRRAPAPSFPSALDEPDEATMPAFERRALLRDKRHRLVADLRRSQGGSHAEINRWLNRSCGVRRVEDASIEQLERSIELLLGRLSARR